MKNLKEFVAAIIENGGSTYNLANGGTVHDGYMVSKKGFEMKFPSNTDVKSAVCHFIMLYGFELFEPENYIGAWTDEGILYLDISNHYTDKDEALNQGRANDQKAIYDVTNQESIYL